MNTNTLAIDHNHSKTVDWILAVIFVVSHILQSITSFIPGISYGELALGICLGAAILFYGLSDIRISRLNADMLIYFSICLSISLCVSLVLYPFSMYDFTIRIIRWFFYIFCSLVLSANIKLNILEKILVVAAIVIAGLLLIQVFIFHAYGRVIYFSINKTILGASIERFAVFGSSRKTIVRFSSLFSEPAHFAYFETLALVLVLFRKQPKEFTFSDIATVFLITLSLVFSSSSYALLLLFVIFLIFVSKILIESKSKRSIVFILLFLSICIALFLFMRSTMLYSYATSKLLAFGKTNRSTFAWNRSLDFTPLQKIFGVGIGNEENFVRHTFGLELPYNNSPSLAFMYCGFVGVTLMQIYFILNVVRLKNVSRIILILFWVISTFSTAFFSPAMILYNVVISLICSKNTLGESIDEKTIRIQ